MFSSRRTMWSRRHRQEHCHRVHRCNLNIYDNPLGVMTNSPAFDWQMTNLRNYVNFL